MKYLQIICQFLKQSATEVVFNMFSRNLCMRHTINLENNLEHISIVNIKMITLVADLNCRVIRTVNNLNY